MLLGCTSVYAALAATGYWLFGSYTLAVILTATSTIGSVALMYLWHRIR